MEPILIASLMGAAQPKAKPPARHVQRARGRAVVKIVRPARASTASWERGKHRAQRIERMVPDRNGKKRPHRLFEYE